MADRCPDAGGHPLPQRGVAMTRRKTIFIRTVLGSLSLIAMVILVGLLISQSDWFKNKVRDRIVAVVETATGGRVEIGSFDYHWHTMTPPVHPFILHVPTPPPP